jgi:anti-sigma B factor antagonist
MTKAGKDVPATGEFPMFLKPMSLKISERRVGRVTILCLRGRITLGPEWKCLDDTVRELVSQGNREILLNLADVSYVDSMGLFALVQAFTVTGQAGGSLRLLGPNKNLQDLLQITKLTTVFEVFESEEEAVRSFGVSTMCCLCPVCQHPSQPSLLDERLERWPTQTCGNCLSRFEARFSADSHDQAQVESLCLATYENEYLQILPGPPLTLQVVGRLDLFSAAALRKAWRALPTPRRVLFDIRQATEISDAGRDALLALLANSEEEARATISLEGLGQEMIKTFAIDPPVYSERATALAALGDVSDMPAWTIQVVRR